MSLMSTVSTVWSEIKADFKGFIAAVEKAVVWLDKEAPLIIAWANKIDPAVGAALALIVHAGELGAETLAHHAASGLGNIVDAVTSGAETSMANAIQASGLSINGKAALTAADVAVINKLRATAHAAVDTALAKVLGVLAPAIPQPPASPTNG